MDWTIRMRTARRPSGPRNPLRRNWSVARNPDFWLRKRWKDWADCSCCQANWLRATRAACRSRCTRNLVAAADTPAAAWTAISSVRFVPFIYSILNRRFGRRFQLRRIRLSRRTLRLQSSWNLSRSRSQLPTNVHQSMLLRFRLSWRVQVLLFRMQLHLFQALVSR